jgi:hypothetical protein
MLNKSAGLRIEDVIPEGDNVNIPPILRLCIED